MASLCWIPKRKEANNNRDTPTFNTDGVKVAIIMSSMSLIGNKGNYTMHYMNIKKLEFTEPPPVEGAIAAITPLYAELPTEAVTDIE